MVENYHFSLYAVLECWYPRKLRKLRNIHAKTLFPSLCVYLETSFRKKFALEKQE